ncbi:MAG: alpha-L-fucosidase, partial [Spirochaetes bacterium]|nr:alpha-L-fucosidase [Spirochaetota bacterium]
MNPAAHARWFAEARYGLFFHWGAHARWGRGAQALARELIPQIDWIKAACEWNPGHFKPRAWAEAAAEGGFKYAVLGARGQDGFCLFETATTEFSTARQAMGRDVVREWLEAFREAGLRVGLQYSWSDFLHTEYLRGPRRDPEGWARYVAMAHAQVGELLTNYGPIDLFRFEGAWPWTPEDWQGAQLLGKMRDLQPHLLVNNRFGTWSDAPDQAPPEPQPETRDLDDGNLGDFGTPEHPHGVGGLPEEAAWPATWSSPGHGAGERWREADQILDLLCESASTGRNLLLGVAPDGEGRLPREFTERSGRIGRWLAIHGEAIYGTQGCEVGESLSFGRQTRLGDALYLVIRFWPEGGWLRLAGLANRVRKASLLGEGRRLEAVPDAWGITIRGLPKKSPELLFPVIKLELYGEPEALPSWERGLWNG